MEMRNVIKGWRHFWKKWGGSVKKSILFARSNIRRSRGQTAAVAVLTMIAAVMMNLWLMLSIDYKQNFELCHDRLNDGHVNLIAGCEEADFCNYLEEILREDPEVMEYCITNAIFTGGVFPYGTGEVSQNMVILEKETALSRKTGKFEIMEESGEKSGIYLPMLYGTGDNYSVGDTIEIAFNNEKIQFTICGFFNSAMTGSHNCGMLSLLLTEDKYREFAEKSSAAKAVYTSVRIKDQDCGERFDASLKNAISKKYPNVPVLSNYYEMITTSRYISQLICAGIMSAMAFFVLMIGVVVISSNVANYIQENMQNLGVLKAIGYTGGQLVFSLMIQFSGISAVAAAAGVGLSYYFFFPVNRMMIAQTGIPYQVKFLPQLFAVTVLCISGIVAAAVYLSAAKIRRIEPITAIRGGIATHDFKKDPLPLSKTSLPLNLALAMKTTFLGMKRNAAVCVTMLVLSLVLVFSTLMFENAIISIQPFVDLISGESADSAINVDAGIEDEFFAAMSGDSRVEKVYLFHKGAEVLHVGGVSLFAAVSDSYSRMNNPDLVISGRLPKYSNEMVIAAKYAKENELKIGDEIVIKAENGEQAFLIVGYCQISDYLGKDCMFTREGYERIGSLQNVTYYLNLEADVDIDEFNAQVTERFGGDVYSTFNFMSLMEGTGSVYVTLITVLVTAIVFLSLIIIVLCMYLLIRMLLNSKKREYGILKALGFTTRQLVMQTALSFMPSVILSTAVGIFLSTLIVNPLVTLFLSGLGIVKCSFSIPTDLNLAAGAGLVLFAFGAACMMSLRVKKIVPRELLGGDV